MAFIHKDIWQCHWPKRIKPSTYPYLSDHQRTTVDDTQYNTSTSFRLREHFSVRFVKRCLLYIPVWQANLNFTQSTINLCIPIKKDTIYLNTYLWDYLWLWLLRSTYWYAKTHIRYQPFPKHLRPLDKPINWIIIDYYTTIVAQYHNLGFRWKMYKLIFNIPVSYDQCLGDSWYWANMVYNCHTINLISFSRWWVCSCLDEVFSIVRK